MITRVYASRVIDAPVETIWAYIRDFNSLSGWFPGVTDSDIEDGRSGTDVGCVRSFVSNGRHRLREQLLALSDQDHRCTYRMLEGPLAVVNYVATLQLTPVTDGDRAFAEWSAEFSCEAEREHELTQVLVHRCYLPAFQMLADRFGGAHKRVVPWISAWKG
jgi:uncharacterized protein YndB with AHSA1/START domain